jgi:translocation protein SEC66
LSMRYENLQLPGIGFHMLIFEQANAFSPTWGQTIFQSANEIAQNQMLRKRMQEIQAQKDSEKEWWENRKKTIEAEFMKELDESPTTKAPGRTSDDDAVLVESGGPADKGQSGSKKNKKKGKH